MRRMVGIRSRWLSGALIAGAVLAWAGGLAPARAEEHSLAGRLLVASPEMGDPRFVETVIYMVRHDATGAMGLVVNRPIGVGPISKLLEEFGEEAGGAEVDILLHYGGPVEGGMGFVLHSTDYFGEGTIVVDDGVALSANLDVLKAIDAGKGPKRRLFAIGYAGWGAGQLEAELAAQAWYVVPADERLIFDDSSEGKWQRAMAKRGVDL